MRRTEAAPAAILPGRETQRLAGSAFFSFISLGMTVVVLGPALPQLAENTGSSVAAISYLFVAQNAGYLLGSMAGARLYDRLPAARLMAFAFLAMLPALALIPLSRVLALLLALCAALGLLQGVVDVGGNLMVLSTPAKGRGVRMNALHTFFGVGALLAPIALAQAVRRSGRVGWGFWALALVILAAGLWLMRLPALRLTGSVPADSAAKARPRPGLVGLVFAFGFLAVGAEMAFGAWITTYALRRQFADAVTAQYLNSVFWASLAGGRLAATLLALRLGQRPLILAGLAGCLASAGAMLAWPGAAAAVWAGTAVYGFFIGPLVANMLALAGESMPVTGKVTGMFVIGLSLGGIVLPWLIGQLFEPLGPWVLHVVLLAAIGLAAAGFFLFLRWIRAPGPR